MFWQCHAVRCVVNSTQGIALQFEPSTKTGTQDIDRANRYCILDLLDEMGCDGADVFGPGEPHADHQGGAVTELRSGAGRNMFEALAVADLQLGGEGSEGLDDLDAGFELIAVQAVGIGPEVEQQHQWPRSMVLGCLGCWLDALGSVDGLASMLSGHAV